MEPPRRTNVGDPVQKISPHVIAWGILGLLLVVGLIFLFTSREGPDEDRLGDNVGTATVAGEDPEARCAQSANNDRIKRELFRRAGAQRGEDLETLDQIAGFAVLRAETPILRGYDQRAESVSCSAYITIDLPPGIVMAGGRRSLSAEVGYRMPGPNGAPLELTDAEGVISSLAGISRDGPPIEATEPGEAVDPVAGQLPQEGVPDDLAPRPARYPGRPSFNCDNAATRGEIAVCNDPGLSSLDVNMAAQYRRAIAAASPGQRAALVQTRDRFLAYRDGCPTAACMRDAYVGRMREIRDIVESR